MPHRLLLVLLPALLLGGGCARNERVQTAAVSLVEPAPPEPEIPLAWRPLATPADVTRLERLDDAWAKGLTDARRFMTQVKGEGPLLDPDAALARPTPPPGRYRCRVVKLGTRAGAPGFAAFKPFFCWVEADGELTTLVKETGTQRPTGRLWSDGDDTRLIFLGSEARGQEVAAPAYGAEPARDVAGVVERIDAFRWRLVLPWPLAGGALDVIEMVPFMPDQSAGTTGRVRAPSSM